MAVRGGKEYLKRIFLWEDWLIDSGEIKIIRSGRPRWLVQIENHARPFRINGQL